MKPSLSRNCTAFAGSKRIASGNLMEVASAVKKHLQKARGESILVFDDVTSAQLEIDWRGTADAVLKRLREEAEPGDDGDVAVKSGPGRPKLGVISREVSLLPRHWEWLSLQRGGASVTLRKLVEEARKTARGQDAVRQAEESTHRFMTAMAGDLPYYEEALRAFYAKDEGRFSHLISPWPRDLREHISKLAAPVFEG